jgi:hypothetical protein
LAKALANHEKLAARFPQNAALAREIAAFRAAIAKAEALPDRAQAR